MAKTKTEKKSIENYELTAEEQKIADEPAYIVGQWYQFAVPGGFMMFGKLVKVLGLGQVRFARVRHMRNAGNVELPAMCASGFSPETQITAAAWRYWDGTPLWKAPWYADTADLDKK